MSQWRHPRAFAKHKLAVIALNVLILLYLTAIFAPFCAPYSSQTRDLDHQYCPPQLVRWSPSRGFYVYAMQLMVDPVTFRKTYIERTDTPVYLSLFVTGAPYKCTVPHGPPPDVGQGRKRPRIAKGFRRRSISLRRKYGCHILSRIIYGPIRFRSAHRNRHDLHPGYDDSRDLGYVVADGLTWSSAALRSSIPFPHLPLWIAQRGDATGLVVAVRCILRHAGVTH
jgi:peptide/nickel transport system permease protein